jgi:hypothetical protein
MANGHKFLERGAYARSLVELGVHRRWVKGLMVVGAVIIPIGIWIDDVLVVTVGMIVVIGGGVWRLWLSIPDL